jgi:hypothetical protein
VDGNVYLDYLDSAFNPAIYDLPAIKAAYLEADFLGVSAYVPMPRPE